jgi:acetyltransferase-like isoleucine patch superfamily enzyme
MNLNLILGNLLILSCNRFITYIPSHTIRLLFYKFLMKFDIGDNTSIFMGVWFDTWGNFKIGKNSVINQKCRLDTRGEINIGENVSISAEVCILTADHDLLDLKCQGRVGSVTIEDYVFIGTRAMILRGVTLGKGSAVAAGSIVTRDVLPFTIVAGIPARKIGFRPQNLDYTCNHRVLFR